MDKYSNEMAYAFRQRIDLASDRLATTDSRLVLAGAAAHLRIVSWAESTEIGQHDRMVLVGGPYNSAIEASVDGARARRALLLWALQRRVWLDLGDGRRRGGLTEAGRKFLSEQLGHPVRDQVHGLDVYELLDGIKFVSTQVDPQRQIDAPTALQAMSVWYERDCRLSDKQELAIELFCASGFDKPYRSRFLTLMISLEALFEPSSRPDDVRALISVLEQTTEDSSISPTQKASLLGSLRWLRTESIGQVGHRTARQLLGDGHYDGVSPGKYFRRMYDLRSRIVHTGAVPQDIDLLHVINTLQQFVGDLLLASVQSGAAT